MNFEGITRVLLLEDNEADAGIVRRYLLHAQTGRFEVVWARGAAEAIAQIEQTRPDIGLIDYNLGLHSGLEFLQACRASGLCIPWILLTGAGGLDVAMEARRLGAMDFLDKEELTPVMLERTIRYTLENFRVREELRSMNEVLEARVRRRTRELERSNKDLENFAHVVSHELRLPLQAIVEHIRMARGGQDAEPGGGHLARALETAQGLQALVRNMLDLARLATNEKRFLPASMRLVAESAARELTPLAMEKGAHIAIGPMPILMGDPYFLGLLFQNLIGNALVHGGESPCVSVTASRENGAWRFRVADNGRGIPPEAGERVFAMFGRTGGPPGEGGYGVGLPLCRRIVEFHGGRIGLESPAGGGAVVSFSIPAQAEDPLDLEMAAGACG